MAPLLPPLRAVTRKRKALHGTKVLLVEDAKDIRDVFTLLLEAEGAEVVATGSGAEAAELGATGDFDVLLTDLGLPDVPGEVVIRHIVTSAPRRPWVVVVTGYEEPFVSRARAAGADLVLTKPIAWSSLLPRLAPATPLAA
jgi:two-component system, chemotaxis family, CheB/CheR fusion protein